MQLNINGNYKILSACFFACLLLTGCDPRRVKIDNETKIATKKVCFAIAGGSFGKAGLRARQFIGKGPKMRVVQWKTGDFQDDLQVVQSVDERGYKPNIAALISWRVSQNGGTLESSFESLEAYSVNLSDTDAARAAYWRFTIFDGEAIILEASSPISGKIRDLFSSEGRGIILPNNIGEALGGVNGGRFEIALLDDKKQEIVKRFIIPSRGYEFKDNAKLSIEGLETALLNPNNCQAPATQLRTN